MKTKLMIVILVAACSGLMAGCGSDNTSASAVCTATTKVCLKSGTN